MIRTNLKELFTALEVRTGLTGTEIAKRLGVTPTTYYSARGTLKRASGSVTVATLDRIEQEFGIALVVPNPDLMAGK